MNQNSPFSQRSTPLEGARVKASLDGFSTKIQSLNNNSSETLQLIKSQLLVNESVVKGIESMKEEIKEAEGMKGVLRELVGPPLKKLIKLSTSLETNLITVNSTLDSQSKTSKENHKKLCKYLEGQVKQLEKDRIGLNEKLTEVSMNVEGKIIKLSSQVNEMEKRMLDKMNELIKTNEEELNRLEKGHREEMKVLQFHHQGRLDKLSSQIDQLSNSFAPLLGLTPILLHLIEQHPQIVSQLCSPQQSPIRSSNAHPSSISQNSSHHKNFSNSLPLVSPNTSVLDCGAEKDQSKYKIQPLPFDRIPIQQSTSENPFISQRALFADPQTALTPPNPFARVIHSNPGGEKNKKVLRANVKELELKSKAENGSGSIESARKKRRIEQSDSEDELEELEIGLKVGMSFED